MNDDEAPGALSTAAFIESLRRAAAPDLVPDAPAIPGVSIVGVIGRGGMGVVYLGRDDATGREVAVKVLSGVGAVTPSARQRVRREAEILARLDHPNIVPVLSSGGWQDPRPGLSSPPYIVMPLIPGGTLKQFTGTERLPRREAARMIRDVALAIDEVHAHGVVHRDIKPSNVLIDAPADPGGSPRPRLADFGLARREHSVAPPTVDGMVLGTPGYLAPEQAGLDPDLGRVGPATDIHGLGATLYFLLAGRPPYEGRSFAESLARAIQGSIDWSAPTIADLPADLRTIVEKCLERSPQARYASARDLAHDLDAFLDHRPIRARRRRLRTRLAVWSRRHPLRAVVAASIFALVVMAGGAGVHVARVASADRATAASREVARRTMARLTDQRVQQILAQGKPLDDHGRRFLADARKSFLEWPIAGDARGTLLFRAKGVKGVAHALDRLGWTDDAAACFAECRHCFEELGRRGLVDAGVRGSWFAALREETFFLVESGRPAAAEPLVARALAILDEGLDPPAGPSDRGLALVDQGVVLSALGKHEESAIVITLALDALRQAARAHPDDPGVAEAEQQGLYNAANCSWNAGRMEERLARLRSLVEGSEGSMARFLDAPPLLRRSRMLGLAALASTALAAGLHEEAIAVSRCLGDEARARLDIDPGDAFLRGKILEAEVTRAQGAMRLRRPQEAEAPIGEAVRLAEGFVADEPAVYFHVRRLVLALRDQAGQRAAVGRLVEAIDTVRRIRTLLEPWRDAEAHGEDIVNLIAMSYGEEAGYAWRAGDPSGAISLLETAIAIAPNPQRGQLLLALADASAATGDTERTRRAVSEAMTDAACVEPARAILSRLAD